MSKSIRLSKKMESLVIFARFCDTHKIDPRDVAELVTLADRAHKAGERDCNEGSDASDKAYTRAHAAFEAKAKGLGFGTQWPGLHPHLIKDGRDVFLPTI